MQNALGLMMDQSVMFAIIIALGAAGIIGLFLAVYWPPRWHLQYRIEVFFAAFLVGLAVYADARSTTTYQAYESVLPKKEMVSGNWDADIKEGDFDRIIKVYAYQWGFTFFDEKGAASRNAVKVEPGEKVMFALMANDVIHGFNIPAARMTTEFEPGLMRYIWIRAPKKPGKYLIQCLNYCGLGHAQMKAWLIVGDGGGEAGTSRTS